MLYLFRPTIRQVLFAVTCLASQVTSADAAQAGASTQDSVPRWLAWKVFHQSLASLVQRSVDLNALLGRKFGLTAVEIPNFVTAGQSFLASLERIDAEAKAEVLRRYPDIRTAGGP